ncbi:MAG: methylated-DNA--[protein]-cysteine S-methyltransferase [Fimbriimonadaceae bacterium]
MRTEFLRSEFGTLRIHTLANDELLRVSFSENDVGRVEPDGDHSIAYRQLSEFFQRQRTEFDLKLALNRVGTPFQHRVWDLVSKIPFGQARTYGQLAIMLGDRSLARAIGNANAKNPFAIIVPCHRVIGADGSLTGYAGGLHRKAAILAFEQGVSGGLF